MSWYNESDVGLTFERGANPEFAEFAEEWDGATVEVQKYQWKLGDLWNFGERIYGERASQVIDVRRVSRRRVSTFAWVSRKFSGRRRRWRRAGLSFYHHEAVASMVDDPDAPELTKEAQKLLAAADDLGLSVHDLEEEAGRLRGEGGEQLNALALIQQARNLCEEAEPLVNGSVRSLVRSSRSTLEDAIGELSLDQEHIRVTQAWFPKNQQEAEAVG